MAPIHDAARAGDTEALRRELERGVSPDAHAASVLGNLGSTPLFIASGHSRADCVRILLQAGADPNVRVLKSPSTLTWAEFSAPAASRTTKEPTSPPSPRRCRRSSRTSCRRSSSAKSSVSESRHRRDVRSTRAITQVEFYLHAGFYPFTAAKAPATAPAA